MLLATSRCDTVDIIDIRKLYYQRVLVIFKLKITYQKVRKEEMRKIMSQYLWMNES
jgi:hypothetical protein